MTRFDEILYRCKNATQGPWVFGERQNVAGAIYENKTCVYCKHGEPSWVGRRDINGRVMLAHVHETSVPWFDHGIYAYREDGSVSVVNDTQEYGYMTDVDAVFIANARQDVEDMTKALRTIREVHEKVLSVFTRREICVECEVVFPCKTMKIITEMEI